MSEIKKKIIVKDIKNVTSAKGKEYHKLIDKYDNEFPVWDADLAAELLSMKDSYVEISHVDDKWKTVQSVVDLSDKPKPQSIKESTGTILKSSPDTQQSIESQCALKASVKLVGEFKDFLYENKKDFAWDDIIELVVSTHPKLLKAISSDNSQKEEESIYATDEELFPEEDRKVGGKRF